MDMKKGEKGGKVATSGLSYKIIGI